MNPGFFCLTGGEEKSRTASELPAQGLLASGSASRSRSALVATTADPDIVVSVSALTWHISTFDSTVPMCDSCMTCNPRVPLAEPGPENSQDRLPNLRPGSIRKQLLEMPQDTPASEVVCLELDVSLYARKTSVPVLGAAQVWGAQRLAS